MYGMAVVLLASSGCGAKEAPEPDKDLAMLQLGFRPSGDSPTLNHITAKLDELQEVCVGNSRLELADAAASAVEALNEKGFGVTPTKVLNGAVAGSGVFGNVPVDDCRPMFPMLVRAFVDYAGTRPA